MMARAKAVATANGSTSGPSSASSSASTTSRICSGASASAPAATRVRCARPCSARRWATSMGSTTRAGTLDRDYQDPWDTMSTWSACYIAAHDRWTEVGPGSTRPTCAAAAGSTRPASGGRLRELRRGIDLRPLHRRDLPGLLAAELPGPSGAGSVLVELRVPERWDAAIPEATVLVHRFEDNHLPDLRHRRRTRISSRATRSVRPTDADQRAAWGASGRVEVLSISAEAQRRASAMHHRPAPVGARPASRAARLVGGVEVDGGGFFLSGGKVIRIPPKPAHPDRRQLNVHRWPTPSAHGRARPGARDRPAERSRPSRRAASRRSTSWRALRLRSSSCAEACASRVRLRRRRVRRSSAVRGPETMRSRDPRRRTAALGVPAPRRIPQLRGGHGDGVSHGVGASAATHVGVDRSPRVVGRAVVSAREETSGVEDDDRRHAEPERPRICERARGRGAPPDRRARLRQIGDSQLRHGGAGCSRLRLHAKAAAAEPLSGRGLTGSAARSTSSQ